MEALKYLAWHLIYACDEMELYQKLNSVDWSDRKGFVRWVNGCLRRGKSIQTVLRQRHLDEISNLLGQVDDQQWKRAYYDFAYYTLILGNAKVRRKLTLIEE